jgi:hypothetical protein
MSFNADPDPAFYLDLNPDPDSQTNVIHADPDPGQTLPSQNVESLHENILYVDTVIGWVIGEVRKYPTYGGTKLF